MSQAPESYDAWRAQRLAALKAPDGWLNIVARAPLAEGETKVGSAPENDVVLPVGPAHAGRLAQDAEGGVSWLPADGGPALKLALSKSKPPRFTAGTLLLEVTTLNGENALRVRDAASEAPSRLAPIEYFPYDPSWRLRAEWVPLAAPKDLTIDTSKAAVRTQVEATHKAVFRREGVVYELLATHGSPSAPQFVLRDLTSRDSTYPASRFLFGEEVEGGGITLDFNKAINPPCAFTEFAVCPLPPSENLLPLRIEAGEKRLRG